MSKLKRGKAMGKDAIPMGVWKVLSRLKMLLEMSANIMDPEMLQQSGNRLVFVCHIVVSYPDPLLRTGDDVFVFLSLHSFNVEYSDN